MQQKTLALPKYVGHLINNMEHLRTFSAIETTMLLNLCEKLEVVTTIDGVSSLSGIDSTLQDIKTVLLNTFDNGSIHKDDLEYIVKKFLEREAEYLVTTQASSDGWSRNPNNEKCYEEYVTASGHIVSACELRRGLYNQYRNWQHPLDENPNDRGYMIVNTNTLSWVDEERFKSNHSKSGELSFSQALALIENGHHLQRKGWNGKGMWIEYRTGGLVKVDGCDDDFAYTPHMVLVNTNAKTVSNWVPSSTDLHARDWTLFE